MSKWLDCIIHFLGKLFRPGIILIYRLLDDYEQEMLAGRNALVLLRVGFAGSGVRINGKITITSPKEVVIGNNVHIGDNAYFSSAGGLIIGDNTHISRNVTIYTQNHNYQGDALPYDQGVIYEPVSIGRNVWIGMNVSIIPGVHIGDGAIIGMGTVVTRDVAALEVVGNQPARTIKFRDPENYHALDKAQAYSGKNGKPLPVAFLKQYGRTMMDATSTNFFVVSTGRSGTKSIAHLLNQHPDVTCVHERWRTIISLSNRYAYREIDQKAVKLMLEALYARNAIFPFHAYGESDHRFWNLIEALAEVIPESKFIWLVRDGRNVVASTFGRGWYQSEEAARPDVWSRNRLDLGRCCDLAPVEWGALNPFERNCWYWQFVNQNIKTRLSNLAPDRWLRVQLEDLSAGKLLSFLAVGEKDIPVPRKNVAGYQVYSQVSWSRSEKDSFVSICGYLMDELYPGWMDDDAF